MATPRPPLLRLQEPPLPAHFALWELGFRPFYLLASSFAALSIALWALQFAGLLGHAYLQGPLWHAHEMLFGFALAVVVGFLFTAGRNWTGQPTPSGAWLAALAGLWLLGRVLVLSPWGWAAAAVNVAFPLAAAVSLAIPFVKAGNRRNYFFVGLLVLMAMGQLAVHLNTLGVLALPAWAGIGLALDVMLFVLAVMGGRVIPMFTNNGVPGTKAIRHPHVEKAALGAVLLGARLLDAVVEYLPSPLDIPPVHALNPKGEVVERPSADDAPLAALAFKLVSDPFVGHLTFIRVYSGVLASGSAVLNPASA